MNWEKMSAMVLFWLFFGSVDVAAIVTGFHLMRDMILIPWGFIAIGPILAITFAMLMMSWFTFESVMFGGEER